MYIAAVIAALVIGFLAGLLSFRIKSHWCPVCGETLRCPHADQHVRAKAAV